MVKRGHWIPLTLPSPIRELTMPYLWPLDTALRIV
jgi:hypothetical protein